MYGSFLIIFGGFTANGLLNDLYALDLESVN